MLGPTEVKFIDSKMHGIGFGTYEIPPEKVGAALKAAITNGVRHIDCAPLYGNEKQVGVALQEIFAEGAVKREDLWITSKCWNTCHGNVEEALRSTLEDLQLDYVDLYLIHWPMAWEFRGFPVYEKTKGFPGKTARVSHEATWRQMEHMVDLTLTKYIGVANWTISLLRDMLNFARIPPAVNQIELHPYNSRFEHLKEAQEHGVHITAYCPLAHGDPKLLSDPVLSKLAIHHRCTVAQVVFGWLLAKGVSAIPKTSNPLRTKENSEAAKLTADEVLAVDALNRNFVVVDIKRGWNHALHSVESVL